MNSNLKSKVISGAKWTIFNTLYNVLTAPLYQLALAILLLPKQFAYIAVISLIVNLSNLLGNLGIGEAIIQRNKVNSKQISSLFYLNLLFTLLIAFIIYLLIPIIKDFYKLQELELIIKILIITIIFNGTSSIFRAYIQRNLLFKQFSVIQVVRTTIDIVLTIILILLGFGIYGYVYGAVVSTIFYTIMLIVLTYKKTDFKLNYYFNICDTFSFLKFGISISLKKSITEFSKRLDEIIIGGLLSSELLGVYYFGKRLMQQIQTVITNAFGQLLLPMFSKLNNNLENLSKSYNKVSYLIAIVAFPVFIGITVTAELFVPIVFGEKWNGSIIVIQILSIVMIFHVLTANIATSLLYSINKPSLVLSIDIFTLFIYFLCYKIIDIETILSVLFIFSFYTILKTLILQYFVGKNLGYNILKYIFQFKKVLLSSISMGVIVIFVQKFLLNSLNDFLQLFMSILIGVSSYLFIQWIIDKVTMKEAISLFLNKYTNDKIKSKRMEKY